MVSEPQISVVVPLFDEEENVHPLVQSIREALENGPDWELILVDDGSGDGTFEEASREAAAHARVRLLGLARNYGQTTAMQCGFDNARGEVVVTMDGDLQNDPRDIPRLLARVRDGYDLVVGYRQSRSESLLVRKIPSQAANRLIQAITRVPIKDNGCTLKALRRAVLRDLDLYSDMHRFIPALVASTASARIAEIPVSDRPRRFGRSKYGLSRVWKVLADLLTITMLRWFRERPLAMFGWGAAGSIVMGILFLVATLVANVAFGVVKADAVVLPGATFLWFGLAGYLLLLGLICEVALRQATESRGVGPILRQGGA